MTSTEPGSGPRSQFHSGGDDRSPVLGREVDGDKEEIQAQLAEPGRLVRGQPLPSGREGNAELWQGPGGLAEVDRARATVLRPGGAHFRSARDPSAGRIQTEVNRLVNRCARLQANRVRDPERGAVGLERGVGPVPLVLHLEQVALEPDVGLDAARGRPADPAHLLEWLVRRDPHGKRADGRPVRSVDGHRQPGHLERVEEAEADPVAEEAGLGCPVHRVRDRAVRPAADPPVPAEREVPFAMARRERDLEGVAVILDLDVLESPCDRAPALIAHGDVDSADQLVTTEPQPAQLRALEGDRQRAGAENPAPDRRVVCGGAAGHGRSVVPLRGAPAPSTTPDAR